MIFKLLLCSMLLVQNAYAITIMGQFNGLQCTSSCINHQCTSTCSTPDDVLVGNGDVISTSLNNTNFDSLSVHGVQAHVRQGDNYSVLVRSDSNLTDNIVIEQTNRHLLISLEPGTYQQATLAVLIQLPQLKHLETHGAQDLVLENFTQPSVDIVAQGAGTIRGKNNTFDRLSYNGQGATTLDLFSGGIMNADIHTEGANDISLAFTDHAGMLSGVLNGVSSLSYCGNPDNQLDALGVSDIQQIQC